jgi:hypothetical protein
MDTTRGVPRLEVAIGSRFERIASARRETERRLDERGQRLTALDIDEGGTIVLTGSWGRREVTSESDDDFMVLFEGAERDDARPDVADVAELLDARQPGREEIFGSHVWLDDLRGKIGRDEDSNSNLTRRMLFVLESVPVAGEEIFQRARRALLAGYLDANVKDHRPPRFFLK